MSRGDSLGDGEVLAVRDADLAACGVDRFLGEHLVGEVKLGLLEGFRFLFVDGVWQGALKDVLLLVGDRIEDFGGQSKVLSCDGLWCLGMMVSMILEEVLELRVLRVPTSQSEGMSTLQKNVHRRISAGTPCRSD